MKARRALLAGCAGIVASFATMSACGMLPPPNLQPPRIAFMGLSIKEVGLERVRFTVRIEADNPNPVDIPLSDVRFGLAIFGEPLATGAVGEPRVTLPARGRRELPIEFSVASGDVAAVLRRAASGPWPDGVWELNGTARWGDTGFEIPFQRRGDSDSLRRLRETFRR
jgi:LEA14-like dessication related protein